MSHIQTYDPVAGTHVRDACAYLADHAPCEATFNGIKLRSSPGETAGDLLARFDRAQEAKSAAWNASPEGKRAEAERLARIDEAQIKIDIGIASLPTLDFGDSAAVVSWVEDITYPANHVGMKLDKEAVIATFAERGWPVGVNCGADFDAEDARNHAGWIVGQWLACGHPMMAAFAKDWRAKFAAAKAG